MHTYHVSWTPRIFRKCLVLIKQTCWSMWNSLRDWPDINLHFMDLAGHWETAVSPSLHRMGDGKGLDRSIQCAGPMCAHAEMHASTHTYIRMLNAADSGGSGVHRSSLASLMSVLCPWLMVKDSQGQCLPEGHLRSDHTACVDCKAPPSHGQPTQGWILSTHWVTSNTWELQEGAGSPLQVPKDD